MISTLRIVLGWLCLASCAVAMWKQASLLIVAAFLVAALILQSGVWRIRPVLRKSEDQKASELLFSVIATFAFLIGAFTGHAWVCWAVLGCVVAFGIGRDIWLLFHEKRTLKKTNG
jgi:hypothetical protein